MTWVTRGSLSAYILSLCPSTRDIFVPSSLHEIYQTVLKNIFIFPYFFIISPWKMAGPFIWIHFNSPSPKMLCAKFGWNWLHGSGEKEFLNFLTVSLLFPLEKERGPSYEYIWTPLIQEWFVPSLDEIGCMVLVKRILNFVNFFSLFPYYFPLKKSGALHLNKLKFLLPKNGLCHVLLNLAKLFWRRKLLDFDNVFLLSLLSPLEKGWTLLLNKPESRLPKDDLCQFGWNWCKGSEEKYF